MRLQHGGDGVRRRQRERGGAGIEQQLAGGRGGQVDAAVNGCEGHAVRGIVLIDGPAPAGQLLDGGLWMTLCLAKVNDSVNASASTKSQQGAPLRTATVASSAGRRTRMLLAYLVCASWQGFEGARLKNCASCSPDAGDNRPSRAKGLPRELALLLSDSSYTHNFTFLFCLSIVVSCQLSLSLVPPFLGREHRFNTPTFPLYNVIPLSTSAAVHAKILQKQMDTGINQSPGNKFISHAQQALLT